jgi:3',5'-cyclic AMP phosphodiesterase CpdA
MSRALAIAIVAAAAVTGCGADVPAGGGAGGSTLQATWRDPSGSGVLERESGEAPVDRTDLAPRARAGGELARFGLLTDAHVRDEESPARATFLDRLGGAFTPTFRPQETLTTQVLAGALRALRAQGPRQIVEAGDLIDNAQRNELDQALAVLHGGRVDPDSGAPGYTGVQDAANPDPFFYRPDVDPPRHPELAAAAQRPFTSPGAGVPWLPVVGNHDVRVAGVVAPTARLNAIATGGWALADVDAQAALAELGTSAPSAAAVDRVLAGGLPGRQVAVPRDRARRLLSRPELVGRLRAASGVGGSGPVLDYAADLGPSVRLVVLDTEAADPPGTPSAAQRAWLREQLEAAGDRWVLVASHRPLPGATLALLARDPRVVAALHGHTHRSRIRPYRPAGTRGLWVIGTASLADWPQQARMLSLRERAGGGVVLTTWMVDAQGSRLVGTARELAYLDAQGGRPAGDAGRPSDRNARLYRGPP